MKKNIPLSLMATVLASLLAGCAKPKQIESNPYLTVEVMAIGDQLSHSTRTYVGHLDSEVSINKTFSLGGTLTGVYVHTGQMVRKGQLIAEIDDTQARSLHDGAVATLRQAEDGYARLKKLHEAGGISEVRWVQMETDLEKARQTEISTRKHLEDCRMVAPCDGAINVRDLSVGSSVLPGEVFARIMDIHKMRVTFSVPESEINRVEVGDHAVCTLPSFDNREIAVTISEKAMLPNPMGHTYAVHATLSDNTDLMPGMVAKVHMSKTANVGVVLPAECVQTKAKGLVVWVVEDGKACHRAIRVSDYVRNGVLVSEGLQAGDTVITAGYQKLYTGASVRY